MCLENRTLKINNMPSKLEQLKKEIQRLRPEIEQGWTTTEIIEKLSGKEIYRSKSVKGRPITLEDVLAVLGIIGEKLELDIDREWLVMNKWWDDDTECSWILGKPLDEQSEETINFLFNLICK